MVVLFWDTEVKFCLMNMDKNGGYESRFDLTITIHIPSNNFSKLLKHAWE